MIYALDHNNHQGHRMAKRLGLSFHISVCGNMVPNGITKEARTATEEEVELWAKLVPEEWAVKEHWRGEDIPTPTVTEEELLKMLQYPGVVTMSPSDYDVLWSSEGEHMQFSTDRNLLASGYRGSWGGVVQVWVHPDIPKGYYWRGELRSTPELDRVLAAQVSAELCSY